MSSLPVEASAQNGRSRCATAAVGRQLMQSIERSWLLGCDVTLSSATAAGGCQHFTKSLGYKKYSENHTHAEATVTVVLLICYSSFLSKGKAVPLQAWTGPEGSRKLRLPDFVTTAQDGG